MIIPSIDIQDGKAVQLRQGKELVLTADRDPVDLAREFNRYGEVAVIDLDAALGKGDNLGLVRRICRVAQTRVGGGIRDEDRARKVLRAGADRIIVGTAAEPELLKKFPPERVIVAIDNRRGEVVDRGWTRGTGEDPLDRAARLAPWCGGFLCTFVEREGGLGGMDLGEVEKFREKVGGRLTVAGGVADTAEAVRLNRLGLDVQVGISLYRGFLNLADVVVGSVDFEKIPLVPTVVQDEAGQVLMLAYSSPESLRRALVEGKGIYYSRSRQELWEKGLTSGNTQELVSCRADCDRDALLFTVRQTGPACHTGEETCFGGRRFTLEQLFGILASRRENLPEGSYSARMFKDRGALLGKIREEAEEVITAETRDDRVWEIADVLYFLSLLAVDEGIGFAELEAELGGRRR
jgi:phosphoribosyl-ATP pyrophosphohydrolase